MTKEHLNITEQSQFKITFRIDNRGLWEKSLLELDYIPVFYTNESLDFQQELFRDRGTDSTDFSLIFQSQNKFVGLWPVSSHFENEKKCISTFTHPVMCPLFAENVNQELKKKMFKETLRIIEIIGNINVTSEFYLPFLNSINLNYWYSKSLIFAINTKTEYGLYLKLKKDYIETSKNFRKGTKSSVKQAEHLWNINILEKRDDDLWLQFKNLHYTVSGRKTRSDKSWQLQYENIISGTSFLIALENNKKLIGGGLFLCSRDECEYSTAAYDRNLFDKPIGHLVQKMAIKKMIDRGIKWYRIGDKALETNEIKPTEKDYSISLFKEGFSSNIFPINKTHFYFDSDKINEK